jgi:hypothetical protein
MDAAVGRDAAIDMVATQAMAMAAAKDAAMALAKDASIYRMRLWLWLGLRL